MNEDVKFVICSKSGGCYISYEFIRDKNRSLRYVHYENSSSFFKENIMTMKPLRLILINISER
jgi:hypothetical protein